MDGSLDVLLISVIDRAVDVAQSHQSLIPRVRIGEDTSMLPDALPDDRFQDLLLGIWDELKVDLAVAFEDAEDRLFPSFCTPPSLGQTLETEGSPRLFPEVLELPSVVALIHLHGTAEFPPVTETLLDECLPDRSVSSIDRAIIGKVKDALETSRREADGKPIDDLIPETEWEAFASEEGSRLQSER